MQAMTSATTLIRNIFLTIALAVIVKCGLLIKWPIMFSNGHAIANTAIFANTHNFNTTLTAIIIFFPFSFLI